MTIFKNSNFLSDCEFAATNNIAFEVASKIKKGAPWEAIECDIYSLKIAMQLALNLNAFEVAIFIQRRTGGVFYWSSKRPELLADDALRTL